MNMTKISLDQMCAILAEMTSITEEVPGQGAIIAHRGDHPTHGDTFLIACGDEAIMICDGVRFL